jgi:3-oxoacyl-[acyl-carrier protein] reductase
MSGRFEGKVALVTGGANGLGRAIVQAFLDEGAWVGLLDLETPAIDDASTTLAIAGDVAHPGVAAGFVEQVVQRWGRVDILVNNAGAYPDALVIDMALDQWQRVLDVNITGTFLCSQAFARHCLARGATDGRIVSISSTSARSPRVAGAAYCASKAAIETFSRTLALELGPHHITVNVVAPGYIDVRGWSDRFPDRASDELRFALVRGIPLGQAGIPWISRRPCSSSAPTRLVTLRAPSSTSTAAPWPGGSICRRRQTPAGRMLMGAEEVTVP